MKRAKFNNLEEQREFFLAVKKKLKVGGRKLALLLGLKSRGPIENYTANRTSPPLEIIKKLEDLTSIKAKYSAIEGKIYRKSRGFMPMNLENAEKIIKNKFGKDSEEVYKLIKSDMPFKQIVKNIRKDNYHFDTSKMSRALGAIRTNLLSKIVKNIEPKEGEILLNGFIRPGKKTLEICFNLRPLSKILEKKKIRVGLEISEDRKKIKLFPLTFGRSLFRNQDAIKVLITEKSGLKLRENISIIFNPEDFGLNIYDSIYDKDSQQLARLASQSGFILDSYRSTPSNHKGDLSLFYENKNIILEVTQASSYKSAYFKVGQCYVQKRLWPNAVHILICKEKFLSKECIPALEELDIRIIYSYFDKGWEEKVIKSLLKVK